jgi:hypothetical protein
MAAILAAGWYGLEDARRPGGGEMPGAHGLDTPGLSPLAPRAC